MDAKRWEPVSAVVSASLDTAGAIGRAAAGVVSGPYQVYKTTKGCSTPMEVEPHSSKAEEDGLEILDLMDTMARTLLEGQKSLAADPTPATCSPGDMSIEQHASAAEAFTSHEKPRNRTRQVVKVSARTAGKLLFSPAKGVMLDVPLAAVEGMWALPRLHGDTGYQHTTVTDWKSGGSVAAKSFIHGVHEGMTDIFVKTYTGKKNEGAKGVAKGLSIGFVNLTMKTGAGTLGLIAYPCQGVYRSIHAAMHMKVRKAVKRAKLEEGEWLLKQQPADDVEVGEILRRFMTAMSGKGKGKA